MPRKAKGVHTSPKKSGVKNLPSGYEDKNKDEEGVLTGLMPIYKKGMENRQNYGGQWDEESLSKSIFEFFEYCESKDVKLAKVGLSLWLGISKSQMYEWAKDPVKYGFKSNLVNQAFELIELSYVGRIEKYPTGNIFLLKTSHGHIETSKMDVTSDGKQIGNGLEDVKDTISKLGLDKK